MEKDSLHVFLEACFEDLEPYLLSPVLYWRLTLPLKGVEGDMLTPGSLCLAVRKFIFLAGHIPPTESSFDPVKTMDSIINRHPAIWSKKVNREITDRSHLWSNYIQELAYDPADHWSSYPMAARWRVMCDLLSIYKYNLSNRVLDDIQNTDQQLRNISEPGDFVLEKDLTRAFSKEIHWYLFIKVPKQGGK